MAFEFIDPPSPPVEIKQIELTEREAYALAQLCKRIGWIDARSLAIDDDEAHAMLDACTRLRGDLARAGICVR